MPDDEAPLGRPDLYVVARFLDRLLTPDTEYTKGRLQAATRLNWDLFKRYMAFLEESGLVAVREDAEGRHVVRLTTAGREAHRRLVGWIRGFVGEDHL